MQVFVPGWSRAGPWLRLSKTFGRFNYFFQKLWELHIQRNEKKTIITKMFLLAFFCFMSSIPRKLDMHLQ